MQLPFKRKNFPKSFLFGTATAAYQIEGSSFGGAGPSHWDTFAATPGNVVRAENGAIACDSYHRYGQDLDLVANANFDVFRFSTSWARVMPQGRGAPNPAGLDFYDRLVDAMLERAIKPAATLYHWELPAPLADLGGWANPDMPKWFADFAEVVMRRIGDRVWSAAPVNEPWSVSWLGHFIGAHAPGLRDIRATARAMHHVLVGHGRAIEAMRSLGMRNLGAVNNFELVLPADASEGAQQAAARHDAIMNRWFVQAMMQGSYPALALALEGLEAHLPKGWQDDMATISQPLDWFGINYYTRSLMADDPNTPSPHLKPVPGPLPKTEMGWEIYPEGLYQTLKMVQADYTADLPIYITENGMAAPDRLDDDDRIAYIGAHVGAVQRAIADGVPVNGYFTWSLLDNYEWALGYDKRFGIVRVDFETLERQPKASYHALASALAR